MNPLERLESLERRVAALERGGRAPGQTPMDVRQMIRVVSLAMGVSVPQIMSRSRVERIVWARHVAIFVCHDQLHWSSASLGPPFGLHSTAVQYALSRVRTEISQATPRSADVARCSMAWQNMQAPSHLETLNTPAFNIRQPC